MMMWPVKLLLGILLLAIDASGVRYKLPSESCMCSVSKGDFSTGPKQNSCVTFPAPSWSRDRVLHADYLSV
jgi:hypothetical protein